MKVHRFYLTEPLGTKVLGQPAEITDPRLVHQWHKVLRLQPGEKLVLIDGSGFDYHAEIIEVEKNKAAVRISGKEKNPAEPKREVTLFQSIIKKDNFEWIVQKGTELGVSKFVPVVSERSEKKSLNMERLRVIAMEAVEQSGRANLPQIGEVEKLPKLLERLKLEDGEAIVFNSSGIPFSEFSKSSTQNASRFAIFIGPEGGWSEKELETFKKNKASLYTLGNAVLRAETAAIAAVALVLLEKDNG